MSQAFVKESDEQWLHDILPTETALLAYLAKENNGIRVYEISRYMLKNGKEALKMSNGMDYTKDPDGRWMIV
ncbi:MAG: hypothetical protein WAT19_06655 [Ferruginibacter sp.]